MKKTIIILLLLFRGCSFTYGQFESGYVEQNNHVGFYGAGEAMQGNSVYKSSLKGKYTTTPSSYRINLLYGYQSESFFIVEAGGYFEMGDMGLIAAIGLSTDTERKIHLQALIGGDFNSAFLKLRLVFSRMGIVAAYHSDKQIYLGFIIKLPTN